MKNKNESLHQADFLDNNQQFSVLLSVYKKENPTYLKEALESIFNQTIMPNEVILVEDGPLTKELDDVIIDFKNKYKTIFKNIKFKENRGLGMALHDGIKLCSNEIIFRMDTDDICMPERFEKQLMVFKTLNVDIVGSNIAEYDKNMENCISTRIVPENDIEIKKIIKKRNPMNHVTIAFKKNKVLEAGNYLDMPYFEDYYLWARMAKNNSKFYNIQESLVKVRGGNDMIKRRGGKTYIKPIINFEKSLYKLGLINRLEFFINVVERVLISLIPNNIRFLIYKKVLRK